MIHKTLKLFIFGILISTCACNSSKVSSIDTDKYYLEPITVTDFKNFVAATNYVTDAEKYGWSIVQKNVFDYTTVEGATWLVPNGLDSAKVDFPVAQVSYNDAIAYCKWTNTRLPTYDEYWQLTEKDNRKVVFNTKAFVKASAANVKGNYWDITQADNPMKVRLAGGSIFCNTTTCNGTSRDRELYVDAETGNIHISFSVVKSKN